MIGLYLSGRLTACMLVRLSRLITNAGGAGVEDLARDLVHSRNSTRVVQNALGTETVARECILYVPVPQRVKKARDKRAEILPLPVLPFYEPLAILYRAKPDQFLAHRTDPSILCESFWDHELVKLYGGRNCIPIRLFIDYARMDLPNPALNTHWLF
eukprot:9475775-Pyramimonas_sp.AAC.1